MASTAADVQTSWAPSDAERILRCILDFMRRNSGANSGEGSVRAAKKHLEALEVRKLSFSVPTWLRCLTLRTHKDSLYRPSFSWFGISRNVETKERMFVTVSNCSCPRLKAVLIQAT